MDRHEKSVPDDHRSQATLDVNIISLDDHV